MLPFRSCCYCLVLGICVSRHAYYSVCDHIYELEFAFCEWFSPINPISGQVTSNGCPHETNWFGFFCCADNLISSRSHCWFATEMIWTNMFCFHWKRSSTGVWTSNQRLPHLFEGKTDTFSSKSLLYFFLLVSTLFTLKRLE